MYSAMGNAKCIFCNVIRKSSRGERLFWVAKYSLLWNVSCCIHASRLLFGTTAPRQSELLSQILGRLCKRQ